MTDELAPCVRGCTYPLMDGEVEKPKPAVFGLLCASCFYRLKHALELAPDLMIHMRALMVPGGAPADGQPKSVGFSASAPLRVQVLDDSDGLFAKLTKWSGVVAEEMRIPTPGLPGWVAADEAKGIRSTTPEGAYEQVRAITEWLLIRLEAVAYLDQVRVLHDDLCWGWKVGDDSQPGVFRLQGRYPLDAQPPREAETRECPVCEQRTVAAFWEMNGDPHVYCTRCEWVAPNTDKALVKLDTPEVDPINHLLTQLADLAATRARHHSREVEIVVSSATLTDALEDVTIIHGMPVRVDDSITYAAAEVLWTTPRLRAALDEYQGKEAA